MIISTMNQRFAPVTGTSMYLTDLFLAVVLAVVPVKFKFQSGDEVLSISPGERSF